MTKTISIRLNLLFAFVLVIAVRANAQQITGVWKGQINRKKVEVKIILKGDSLTGTSYYYGPGKEATRYSIKGYFDQQTNEVVWWDDQLIEDNRNSRFSLRGQTPYLSTADFNCPGGARMMLDGEAAKSEDPLKKLGAVALVKQGSTEFPDEWDYIIDNFLVGANYPEIIDSVEELAGTKKPATAPVVAAIPAQEEVINRSPARDMVVIPAAPAVKESPTEIVAAPSIQPKAPLTIEEKFQERSKVLALEVPLLGDSLELRFYDNAEIDGDSISLFLNDHKIFEHIRLAGSAYTIRLAVSDLQASNELIMVAENLGTIPPNTSYMVAESGGKRYEARLESTEGSSAMIRLYKPPGAL